MEGSHGQSERRVIDILENLSEAFISMDREWRILYLNRQAEQFVKRSREELIGESLWEKFPEARGTVFELRYREALRDEKPVEFEEFYPPLDTWFSVRAYPIAQGLALYFLDVSEKRAERARLEESELRFRLLAKATNDAVWDWNPLTNELWWNDGFESMFGASHGALQLDLEAWRSRVHPDDRERIVAEVRQVIEERRPGWVGEYRFRRSDGTYAQVVDKGHLILDDAGRVVRMIGGMADVSERWQAQREVARQAALLEHASDAILVRSLDNRIQYLNSKAVELYGWTPEQALGRPVRELLYQDGATLDAATEAVLERGEWSGEIEHVTRDGKKLLVFGRWTLLRDVTGQPESILAINTDITDKARLDAQLRHTQRMESIGTLASGIAHDLNNVLSPILVAVDLLRELHDDQATAGLLQQIGHCAQRGASLVRQILALAQPFEGEKVVFDAAAVLEEVAQVLRETLPKNIELGWAREPEPRGRWWITGDPTQLHQVLMNLCLNARDAMPSGGRLSVRMEPREVDAIFASMNPGLQPGPHLVLRVEDTGEGIPREIQGKIFEPFFTTKEPGRGTGLGLSTCFSIVKSLAGVIRLDSEVGRGTLVEVYLPMTGEVPGSVVEGAVQESAPGHGQTLLLVDDEDGIREVIGTALERSGFRVLTARNGAEGVLLFAQHRTAIAAVIADMSMPIMDGPAMIAALRSIDPEVTVIGSSGLSSRGQVFQAGAEEFLAKPYTARQLLMTLEKVLRARNPARAAPAVRVGPQVSASDEPSASDQSSAVGADASVEAEHQEILLIEDESMLVVLARRILRADGYHIHAAGSGTEGLEHFVRLAKRLGLVICDLELPGLDGLAIFHEVRRQAPNLPFILTTGQLQLPSELSEAARAGQLELLSKPYSAHQLREKVRAILRPHA